MNRPFEPALFLDRDGIINKDYGYVYKTEDFDFVDGIFDLCLRAKKRKYLIIIITNQAGIGRGYYTEEDFHVLTRWMCSEFKQREVVIDDVLYSPYHPIHGIGKYKFDSTCRKPKPGMILQATRRHRIDLSKSLLIGDRITDMQAGIEAGVKTLYLYHKAGSALTNDCRFSVIDTLDAVVFPD
jgi:D-glycero-D-manno-heptose 1,7-bisphosphate phosphatase